MCLPQLPNMCPNKFKSIISLCYLEIKYILTQVLSKKLKYNLKMHPVAVMEKKKPKPSVERIVH